MWILLLQLAIAQRTHLCASDGSPCPENLPAQSWASINQAIKGTNGDVLVYVVGSTATNRLTLNQESIASKSVELLANAAGQSLVYVNVKTATGSWFDLDTAHSKVHFKPSATDLWATGGDTTVRMQGDWSNNERVSILAATPLTLRLDTESIKMDVTARRQFKMILAKPQAKINGTISLLGSSHMYQNVITCKDVVTDRVALYVTSLHLVGALELDDDRIDVTVKLMDSLGWNTFPVKFALGRKGVATLTVENKWFSPWTKNRYHDKPKWDDDFNTNSLSSDAGKKNGAAAKTLDDDDDEPEEIVVTLINKVKCADNQQTCYVSDAEVAELTSKNWTIVTGPSSSFEFTRFEYELYLSNATTNTPYGFESKYHIFGVTAKAGEFNVDRTTLTVFAKMKPSQYPLHICYTKLEECPKDRITTKVTAEQLGHLNELVPSEIKNVWIAIEANLDANQFVDLTTLPASVDTVKLYSDEKCTVNFKPNPALSTLILEEITLSPETQGSSIELTNPVITLLQLSFTGISFRFGSDSTLRTSPKLYRAFNEPTVRNLDLLGMDDFKYVYFYSDKWVMSKSKLPSPETFAETASSKDLVIMPYNKVSNNFAFELGDDLEDAASGAQVLGWWDKWFEEAERLNLIPVFGAEETLRVRPLKVMSTEDSVEIFISKEWENVTFDENYGSAITIWHDKYSVSVRSQYDDVPVVTEGTGIVRIWRNLKVDNNGRPIFRPGLVLANAEYGFEVSYDGNVVMPFSSIDIAGNCSIVLVNTHERGSAQMSGGQVSCKRDGHFRFTQVEISGKLTLEADSELVPEQMTTPQIEFTGEAEVEVKWFRSHVPVIDIGRQQTKRPRKIVIKYDSDSETDLTAEGYNQIWQSEKNSQGRLVLRGINLDCNAWMNLVSFESDIHGFSADGVFKFECKAVNDSLSASRLLAGESENGIYMRMATPLTDADLRRGPNVGAIVGGVFGGLVVVAAVAIAVFLVLKHKNQKQSTEHAQATNEPLEP